MGYRVGLLCSGSSRVGTRISEYKWLLHIKIWPLLSQIIWSCQTNFDFNNLFIFAVKLEALLSLYSPSSTFAFDDINIIIRGWNIYISLSLYHYIFKLMDYIPTLPPIYKWTDKIFLDFLFIFCYKFVFMVNLQLLCL